MSSSILRVECVVWFIFKLLIWFVVVAISLRDPSEIIDLRTPVRTLGLLEEDNKTGMRTSYIDLLDVTVYLSY